MPTVAPTVPRPREPQHSEEWDLVDRAAGGDLDAFARLYEMHQGQVNRFLHSRTHNMATAEDLTSVVFLRAYATVDRVHYQGLGYSAYLMRIARNVAIDHAKALATKTTFPTSDFDGLDGIDPMQPELEAARGAEALALRDAMGRLTEDQRRVLELRFLAELSIEETAAALGVSTNVVKSRQARACRALLRDPAIQAMAPRRDS